MRLYSFNAHRTFVIDNVKFLRLKVNTIVFTKF